MKERGPIVAESAEFTISVLYLRQMAEFVRDRGGSVDHWLALSGLRAEHLENPAVMLRPTVFHQLVCDAITLTGEPAMGLFVGEKLLPSTHGMLGYAALNSGSIRQALELAERFASLRFSLVSISHRIQGKDVHVEFHTSSDLDDIRRPLLEATVLSIKNVLDEITRGTCPVARVCFPFERTSYHHLAMDIFRCPILYKQSWTGMVFPKASFDAPLKLADPEAFAQAAMICQRELDKLSTSDSWSSRVRRLLLEKRNGFPTLPVVARHFNMTPRTLHRRLEEEGLSFRELLEKARHDLAIEHLKSKRFSIQEIAFMLGYSDLANFRRAFKRWEGVAPTEYLQRGRSRRT